MPTKGQLLAQGRQAEVFAWGETHVLKLFREGHWPQAAQHEARIARAAHAGGVRTPAVMDVIDYEGRAGIVYERINGESMLRVMQKQLWRLSALARSLAELHCAIHRLPAPPELPNAHARIRQGIESATALPEALKRGALQRLMELPQSDRLGHGDFHPDNVLLSAEGLVILDWPNAASGHPLADVMLTSILLRAADLPPTIPLPMRALIALVRGHFHATYLQHYLKLTGFTEAEMRRWQAPIAAARLSENILPERKQLLALVQAGL